MWRLIGVCVLACAIVGCSDLTPPKAFLVDGYPSTDATLKLADIGKACTPSSPATVLSGPRLDSIPVHARMQNGGSDSVWYALAQQIPGGLGGVFEYENVAYVFLTDTTKRKAAIAGLEATPTGEGMESMGLPLLTARALQGRWNFAQLADWYAFVLSHRTPGPTWTSDISEARNRLEFGVANEDARATLETYLKGLDVPCNLIAIYIAPVIHPA